MQKLFTALAVLVFLIGLPASVHAAKGTNVTFPVFVVADATVEPPIIIKNSFVAMYKVKLVDMGGYENYEANQVAIKPTGKKGTAAKFLVKPNEVVYFLGFKTKKDAVAVKKFTPQTPPVKNFTKQDGIKGQLCMTDGVDFSQKFDFSGADGIATDSPCAKKWTVELYNGTPKTSDPKPSFPDGTIESFPVSVGDFSTDPAKIIPNTFVAMYSVTLTGNGMGYDGTQVAVMPTGPGGKEATFFIKKNDVVYFLGFSSAATAAQYKKYTPETPPYKNFDGNGKLCMTAGVDFSKKFAPDNQEWCSSSQQVEIKK